MKIRYIVALIIITFISYLVVFYRIRPTVGLENFLLIKLSNGLFTLSICETGGLFGVLLVKVKNIGLKILCGLLAVTILLIGLVLFYSCVIVGLLV